MAAIIHPLRTLLASLTRQELAQQVTFLKAENQIPRSKHAAGIPLWANMTETLATFLITVGVPPGRAHFPQTDSHLDR